MNITDVITELDNHGFTDTSIQQKMFVINDTLWDLEAVEPWPFLEASFALNFDGINPYPSNMPSNFKHIVYLADTVDGTAISPERVETVRDNYPNLFLTNTGSDPYLYYLWGGKMRLYPIPPASTGRFYMDYIATQPELTSAAVEADILLPPRHHRAITLGSVYKLYAMEDDLQNAQAFQSMYEDKLLRMKNDLLRKQYQRPDRIFMTNIDDWE